MTIGEIIAKIKRYYPKASTWSDADIVSIINDEQKEIFRELQIMAAPFEFDTVINQQTYALPSDCDIEFIKFLGICSDSPITANSIYKEYTFCDLNSELIGYRYYDANGLIGIYPVPTQSGAKAQIIYKKRPALLSAENLTSTPELKEDWHRIFVYGAIIEIAGSGSNPDTTVANNYTLKYNSLMSEIKLAKYNNRPYPRTKNVKDWTR